MVERCCLDPHVPGCPSQAHTTRLWGPCLCWHLSRQGFRHHCQNCQLATHVAHQHDRLKIMSKCSGQRHPQDSQQNIPKVPRAKAFIPFLLPGFSLPSSADRCFLGFIPFISIHTQDRWMSDRLVWALLRCGVHRRRQDLRIVTSFTRLDHAHEGVTWCSWGLFTSALKWRLKEPWRLHDPW